MIQAAGSGPGPQQSINVTELMNEISVTTHYLQNKVQPFQKALHHLASAYLSTHILCWGTASPSYSSPLHVSTVPVPLVSLPDQLLPPSSQSSSDVTCPQFVLTSLLISEVLKNRNVPGHTRQTQKLKQEKGEEGENKGLRYKPDQKLSMKATR